MLVVGRTGRWLCTNKQMIATLAERTAHNGQGRQREVIDMSDRRTGGRRRLQPLMQITF